LLLLLEIYNAITLVSFSDALSIKILST
jgi:hypothetical protein